jgi:hypothetical protein
MAPDGSLDSIEQLRAELVGLAAMKLVQADGPFEMRGVEVDHNLYQPNESKGMTTRPMGADESSDDPVDERATVDGAPAMPAQADRAVSPEIAGRVGALESACVSLQAENRELREQIAKLRETVEYLRHVLGG